MVPHRFNHGLLAFVPKEDSVTGQISWPADRLRPLSLSKSSQKMVASALAYSVAIQASYKISRFQFGGVAGRFLADCLLRSTGAAERAARTDGNALWVLLDFSNAFPSMSRSFLSRVLVAYGIPVCIRRAIEALYINSWHDIRFGGRTFPGFALSEGIRQGCPLAALLFSLAIDPFAQMLNKCSLPLAVPAYGYVDGFNCAIADAEVGLGHFGNSVLTLTAATGMHLTREKMSLYQ